MIPIRNMTRIITRPRYSAQISHGKENAASILTATYSAEDSGRYSTRKENSAEQSVSRKYSRSWPDQVKELGGFLICLESGQIQSNLMPKTRFERNLLRQRFTSLFFFIVVIIIGISVVIGISSRADGRQVILL